MATPRPRSPSARAPLVAAAVASEWTLAWGDGDASNQVGAAPIATSPTAKSSGRARAVSAGSVRGRRHPLAPWTVK
ncbi:unnamed protein product [Urochloa humidicola]